MSHITFTRLSVPLVITIKPELRREAFYNACVEPVGEEVFKPEDELGFNLRFPGYLREVEWEIGHEFKPNTGLDYISVSPPTDLTWAEVSLDDYSKLARFIADFALVPQFPYLLQSGWVGVQSDGKRDLGMELVYLSPTEVSVMMQGTARDGHTRFGNQSESKGFGHTLADQLDTVKSLGETNTLPECRSLFDD